MLRIRLLFSLLTALLVAGIGQGGARAQDCGSADQSGAAPVASCAGGSAALTSADGERAAKLERSSAPSAPAHGEQPGSADGVSEDSPDDEELADLAASALIRAHAPLLHAPASIQLEPAHAPSTQLDRPPRA